MQRKLAAILSADVVGYSGLMEVDEAGTLERLKANRSRIFDPQVARRGGRVFKLMGDGALAEFSSVVDAVNCALAVQEATAQEEQTLPEAERIRYRIGVNLGDVIVDGDDIYGAGVNVAARLQMLAPVGGVALSQTVRDHIEGKTLCVFVDLGEHLLKNIERPVRVYAARAATLGDAHSRPTSSSQRLAICVLPFTNMSGDPEQEYFSDGITEDIITDLSKVAVLSVVSRNSAFMFKGKSVDVPQVAKQLKVTHVLEGSVRKVGQRVRITAQLIDGVRDAHIWAERYDRDLNDIFALQDEISHAIVSALKVKLRPEEKKAIEQRGTTNVDAYNLYLMARNYYVTLNLGDFRRFEAIIRLCRRSIEIDPNYARAWALLAIAQRILRFYFRREGEDGSEAAERAVLLDEGLAEAHAARAGVLTQRALYDEASSEVEIALHLDDESYEANRVAAQLSFRLRRFSDAIRYYEKVAALVEWDYAAVGMLVTCYLAVGDPDGTRSAANRTLLRTERVLAQSPDNGSAMGYSVVALAALGEKTRADELARRAMSIDRENTQMRYSLARAFIQLGDVEAALDLLAPMFSKFHAEGLAGARIEPAFDDVREHPRFKAMLAAAEARLAAKSDSLPFRKH